MMSFNGKGFTIEGLCRRLFTGQRRECVEKLNRHCGSGSDKGVVHVQAPDGNSA